MAALRCWHAASRSMAQGMANTSALCRALPGLRSGRGSNCRAVVLVPSTWPSSSSVTRPSLSPPSAPPGQFNRISQSCGRDSSSASSIARADRATRCRSSGRSGTSTPVRSSMPMQRPSGSNRGAPAQLYALLSSQKCSPRCSQTGASSVSAAPMAVVPTAASDRSTPTRPISWLRGSCRSTAPCTSITTPRALVNIAK